MKEEQKKVTEKQAELKRGIRELEREEAKLDEKVKQLGEKSKKEAKGFLDFIRGQGVIGMAVGLVIGAAASTLVNSLINNVVMPPLGFLLGSSNGLKGLSLNLGTTPAGEVAVLNYGMFLSDFINFFVIAVVVYLVIKWLKVEPKKK